MKDTTVLVVDDEPAIRELVILTLERMNVNAIGAESLAHALALLAERSFDLCLTDLVLGDGSGLSLVETVARDYPTMPIAVITAHGDMQTAISALKAGAFDFVSKPVDLVQLKEMIHTALKVNEAKPFSGDQTLTLIGDSASMQALKKNIDKLAKSQAPLYISGPSGSGKEQVARLIHEKGPRRDQPFIAVNCGAIPSELMESEFFGHLKGSFTGATADKEGLFQAASGGTLFLDEVADLPLAMQVKLLRAIQEKSVRPIGAQQENHVDVRFLSATHKPLADEVAAKRFREDLYYRLNVIELKVPPLCQRQEDIPALAEYFLKKISMQAGQSQYLLDKSAISSLMDYSFPGNVRELENILERAATLCENNVILASDLQLPQVEKSITSPSLPKSHEDSTALDNSLEELEKQKIMAALEANRWNKTRAAKELGITFRALRYRLKKYGLE